MPALTGALLDCEYLVLLSVRFVARKGNVMSKLGPIQYGMSLVILAQRTVHCKCAYKKKIAWYYHISIILVQTPCKCSFPDANAVSHPNSSSIQLITANAQGTNKPPKPQSQHQAYGRQDYPAWSPDGQRRVSHPWQTASCASVSYDIVSIDLLLAVICTHLYGEEGSYHCIKPLCWRCRSRLRPLYSFMALIGPLPLLVSTLVRPVSVDCRILWLS